MPRMIILDRDEQERFEKPPIFDSYQRKRFFRFPQYLLEIARNFREANHQIGFLLACGYFNSSKRFFAPKDYYPIDIEAIARYLDINNNNFNFSSYPTRTRQRHENIILAYYGFKRFDGDTEILLSTEIKFMICGYQKPRLIFEHCLDILVQNRIQLSSSRKIIDLIKTAINHHSCELSKLIETNLIDKTRKRLDDLFTHNLTNNVGDSPSRTTRYKLTILKRISQSTRPTKIKERIDDFQLLKGLHEELKPIINILDLNDEAIRYYAGSVLKSQIFQITRRSDEDRYIHVIAFITHQYSRFQDNLVDVLLGAVQTSQNTAKRVHKEQIYSQRKQQKATLSVLLARLQSEINVMGKIKKLTNDKELDDTRIVQEIRQLLTRENELSAIKVELMSSLQSKKYYGVLEDCSIRLQNKVSPILKALSFKAETGAESLMEAINHFKNKEGSITQNAPLDFLETEELKAVIDEQKIRISLYKSFLFIHVASAIKSGNLNLEQSYKYRPMDEYLINKEQWNSNKDDYLKRAEMVEFSDPKKILKELDNVLYQQYEQTNNNINPHLKVADSGSFKIATPAQDDHDEQPLQPFFPKRHIVPLTEILASINQYCGFLGKFEHWQQKHVQNTIPHRNLYAGIMGLGCSIGTRRMAQISPMVTENELENIINWRFSLENIRAANDCILKATDAMDLPQHYQRVQNKLHTSSDGQKFEVKKDSLNANYTPSSILAKVKG